MKLLIALTLLFTFIQALPAYSTETESVRFDTLNGFVAVPVGLARFGGRFGYSYGAQVGTVFESGMRASVLFQYYGKSDEYQDANGLLFNKSTTVVNVGTEFALFFTRLGIPVPGLAAGLKLGLGTFSDNEETNGVSTPVATESGFFIGPEISYDYILGGNFSIGAELSLVSGPADRSALFILMPIKFWF